jgi:hypothetical protein
LAARFSVPKSHLALLERCVGWLDERPKDASELLPLLRGLQAGQLPPPPTVLAEAPGAEPAAVVPAGESGRMRQALMQSLVKRIEEGHRLLELLERKKYRPLLGTVVIGLALLGIVILLFGNLWLVWGLGLGLAVPLYASLSQLHQNQVKAVQQQIQLAMRTLGEEFPDAVQSWGGEPVLRNPETIREIVRSLPPLVRPPADTAAPSGPAPREERDRHAQLAEGLRQVAQGHAELARFPAPKWLPLPLALALCLVLAGLPLGLAAAFSWYRYFGPWEHSRELYDYLANPLDAAEYALQARRQLAAAAALGLGTLLLVTAVGTWRLVRRPLFRARAALAVAGSLFLLGLPAGAAAGGVWYAYFHPFYVGDNAPEHSTSLHDYRGDSLTLSEYYALDKKAQAEAVAVGVAACALLTALSAGLYLRGLRRRHEGTRRRLAGHVHELAAAFPVTVENWGGAKALENRATVQNLLRAVEPA